MNRMVGAYVTLLCLLVLGWGWRYGAPLSALLHSVDLTLLLGASALYCISHLLRMLRLVLLTLDQRDKAFAVSAAHALTAFPSSFLPFKIGEVLRLAVLFRVFGYRRKAAAVWLAERFGDIVVIAGFILGLYLLQVEVPPAMRTMFVLFVLASLFSLLALFAIAKTFVYLNRHLVLNSHSRHGLKMLKLIHALRQLELDIQRSIEGRLTGVLLLSLVIWLLELGALSMFVNLSAGHGAGIAAVFGNILLAGLSGGASAFGLLQSFALVALTLLFLAALGLAAHFKFVRS
jgi:hypothetical protein